MTIVSISIYPASEPSRVKACSAYELLGQELPGRLTSTQSVHSAGFRFGFGFCKKAFKFGSVIITHFDADPAKAFKPCPYAHAATVEPRDAE